MSTLDASDFFFWPPREPFETSKFRFTNEGKSLLKAKAPNWNVARNSGLLHSAEIRRRRAAARRVPSCNWLDLLSVSLSLYLSHFLLWAASRGPQGCARAVAAATAIRLEGGGAAIVSGGGRGGKDGCSMMMMGMTVPAVTVGRSVWWPAPLFSKKAM